MIETGTLFANNSQEPTDFSSDAQSYLLVKPFRPSTKAHPFQVFQVIVLTEFVEQWNTTLFDEDEGIFLCAKETSAAELMAQLGIFPSKGQARKNGWPGPIPDGWSELRPGKCVVFVWKPNQR